MKARTQVAIILIGEELLSGKIDDINGVYAIRRLREEGLDLRELHCIGDEIDRIASVVRAASETYDVVFTSGGVGPTHDDLTMRGIARAFDVAIEEHAEMSEKIRTNFAHAPDELRVWLRMAMLPQGCEVLESAAMRVPIFKQRNVYMLPGIPELFKLQFDEVMREYRGVPIVVRTIYLNCGEGEIAEHLEAVEGEVPGVKIGSYPVFRFADHRTRVTMESTDSDIVDRGVEALVRLLPEDYVVRLGEGNRI